MFLSLKTGFTGLKTVKHRFRYFITKLNYSLDILIKLPCRMYFQIDKSNHKKSKLDPAVKMTRKLSITQNVAERSEARKTKKALRKNENNTLDN